MLQMVSTFKDRFIQAMEIRNIKAIELSEKTGISESTLSQYKGGYSKPKDKRLAKIADALDVDPAWLMGLNVPMNILEFASVDDCILWSNQNNTTIQLTSTEYKMVMAFRKADIGRQEAILHLLDIDIAQKNEEVI